MVLANGSVTRQAGQKPLGRHARATLLLAVWATSAPLLGVLGQDAMAAAVAAAPALLLLALRPFWVRPGVVEGACLVWAAAVLLWALDAGAGLPAWLLTAPPAAALAALSSRAARGVALALASALLAAALAGTAPAGAARFIEAFAPASLVFALLLLFTLSPPQPQPAPVRPMPASAQPSEARLLAELGHELRTPLTHILGFAEVIELRLMGPAEEKYSEYARVIRASGRHLLDLAETWLEMGRLDAGARTLRPQRFDLAELARGALEAAALAAEQKAIDLAFEGPEAAPVEADAAAFRQILTNLVNNAVKFAPDGGRVRVSVFRLGAVSGIEVEDDGPGVAPEERARLAQPWRQGRAGLEAGGAGLGLALVRRLVELHGGALEIGDSALGGALFRVSAPIALEGEAAGLQEGES